MTFRLFTFLLTVLVCLGPQRAFAESKPLELKWNELAGLIAGHRAMVETAEGVTVTGDVIHRAHFSSIDPCGTIARKLGKVDGDGGGGANWTYGGWLYDRAGD